MFLIKSYHDLFHLFFSFALLHTLKTDSSKSLSLCNLIMEETPDSGLTEEIQRSQIDLGAIIWGPMLLEQCQPENYPRWVT